MKSLPVIRNKRQLAIDFALNFTLSESKKMINHLHTDVRGLIILFWMLETCYINNW